MSFDIDLTDKGWATFGLRGSGKSWLTKAIMDSTPSHLIYDPLNEHKGYQRYVPTDRESIYELERFVKEMVIPWKPAVAIVDEANKYVQPKPSRLPSGIADLNDFARHWHISTGYVARRPVQFHTDIVELADFLFIFNLPGRNDWQYHEDLYRGLGDMVRGLKKYEFAVRPLGQEPFVHAAINEPKHPVTT